MMQRNSKATGLGSGKDRQVRKQTQGIRAVNTDHSWVLLMIKGQESEKATMCLTCTNILPKTA